MIDKLTKIIIACPLDKVAGYTSNPDNAPEWYINIRSVEWKPPRPLREGSKIAFKARFLWRDLSYIYEVCEYIPDKKLVMRTADGPFPMETTYTWEAIDEHNTLMTLRNRGNPKGFSIFLTPFMSAMIERANNKDLEKLKSILE